MIEYRVQPGDTIFAIARRYGITVDALLAANPNIKDPNIIYVGQIIIVPVTTPLPIVCPVLKMGDMGPDVSRLQIALITNGYNPGPVDGVFGAMTDAAVKCVQTVYCLPVTGIVDVPTWMALGVDCSQIPVPPVPPTPPPPSPGFDYIVQPGDTMFNIAKKFGVSLNHLIAANPQIKNPNMIFPGDRLRIPNDP